LINDLNDFGILSVNPDTAMWRAVDVHGLSEIEGSRVCPLGMSPRFELRFNWRKTGQGLGLYHSEKEVVKTARDFYESFYINKTILVSFAAFSINTHRELLPQFYAAVST
jgi:hypothetical protein